MREFSIIKKRILQYLEFKGISKYKFYQETGITNGILSQSNGISEDSVLEFLSYYRDISAEWLLTGEGEMLKKEGEIGSNGKEEETEREQIERLSKEAKTRIIIDPDTRKKIMGQLNGSPFLLVCMLVYHSLIRPKEIRNIKVGDIDMTAHAIRISGEVAKNHNARYAAMSAQIENLITELKILKNPKDWYVFSDRETMKPGTVILYDAKFTKEFAKLRKLLNLDPKMQLYSFRDTGIFEMLKAGIDDLSVMQHADHSSLDITTIYANHYDPKLNERIRAKAPEF